MDNIELLRKSAEAMGWKHKTVNGAPTDTVFYQRNVRPKPDWCEWNPLRDDKQAMALLKHLGMRVDYDKAALNDRPKWYAQTFDYKRSKWNQPAEADDLNRAIVECAAWCVTHATSMPAAAQQREKA